MSAQKTERAPFLSRRVLPLTQRASWGRLLAHRRNLRATPLRELFARDAQRFERFSLALPEPNILLDYSKNAISARTLELLCDLARECGLEGARAALFGGELINSTEQRAALHVALRAAPGESFSFAGRNVVPDVQEVLAQMRDLAALWRAPDSGVRDIVHLGIGGSALGPAMVVQALARADTTGPRLHFVSNIDGHALQRVLAPLQPAHTFFIVASKTFTTAETLRNAQSAKDWLSTQLPAEEAQRHFIALTTNNAAAEAFGIPLERQLGFWDWVGGRFSLWSAVGLPILMALGSEDFDALLAGARSMDRHFLEAPLHANMPVLLALMSLWNCQIAGARAEVMAPYDERLRLVPDWLQQLSMESLGKGVLRDGKETKHAGPLLLGGVGTDAQHSFFQWLHQAPGGVAVDFIACVQPDHDRVEHHHALLANMLAQSRALMQGQTLKEARDGLPEAQRRTLAPHCVFPGNRASNTILLGQLDAAHLGALLALYEHKIFALGVLLGINPFDQYGVELGKRIAKGIEPLLRGEDAQAASMDASTRSLIAHIRSDGA